MQPHGYHYKVQNISNKKKHQSRRYTRVLLITFLATFLGVIIHSVKSYLKLAQLVFVNRFNLHVHFRVQIDTVLSSQGQVLCNYTHTDTQTHLEIRAPELPKHGR